MKKEATDVFGKPLALNQLFPEVKGILAGVPRAHGRPTILQAIRKSGNGLFECSGATAAARFDGCEVFMHN